MDHSSFLGTERVFMGHLLCACHFNENGHEAILTSISKQMCFTMEVPQNLICVCMCVWVCTCTHMPERWLSRPDNLNSVPRTHIKKADFCKLSFDLICTLPCVHTYARTQTHQISKAYLYACNLRNASPCYSAWLSLQSSLIHTRAPLNQWAVADAMSTCLLVPRVPFIQKVCMCHLSGCCDQMIRGNLKEDRLTYLSQFKG